MFKAEKRNITKTTRIDKIVTTHRSREHFSLKNEKCDQTRITVISLKSNEIENGDPPFLKIHQIVLGVI